MSRQFIAPTCDIVARNKIKALEAKVGGGSSGGGVFVITAFTDIDENTDETRGLMVDKSIEEIASACESGKIVVMKKDGVGIYHACDISCNWETGAFENIGFCRNKYSGNGYFESELIEIGSDGTVLMWFAETEGFSAIYDRISVPMTQIPTN